MYEIKEFLLDINYLSRHISVIMPCSFVSTKKKKTVQTQNQSNVPCFFQCIASKSNYFVTKKKSSNSTKKFKGKSSNLTVSGIKSSQKWL